MKKIFLLAFILTGVHAFAQKSSGTYTLREVGPGEMTICPVSEHSGDLYLPPYADRILNNSRKGNLFKDSLLNVTPEFIPAVDFVLNFLENYFSSDVTINVWVEIDELGGTALAGARPAFVVENFDYAPHQDTEYPIALAEKLLGKEINRSDQPDIIITINSEFESWFLTPNDPTGIRPDQIDLASVLTHEMIHGLGFFESGQVNEDGEGSLAGFLGNDHPVAFDRNIINGDRQYLYTSFESPSLEMAEQFTSDDLFYKSETFIIEGTMPELYAPTQFAPGSSLAHLGESYNGGRDALMTFAFQGGEVIYFPGDFTLDIMYDMGWDATRIVHEPGIFSEDINSPYEIIASIEADSPVAPGSFKLHYSTDSFATIDMVLDMAEDGGSGVYKVTLPAPAMPLEYQYYFEVTDGRGIKRTRPGGGPDYFFTYNYGEDSDPPVMEDPLDIVVIATDDSFPLQVEAVDHFSGVREVRAIVRVNSQTDTIALNQSIVNNGNTYFETYNFNRTFIPTDTIEYRFLAVDNSSNANASVFPADSFLKGTYLVDDIPPIIEHDPVTSVTNFDKSFLIKLAAFDDFVGVSQAFGVVQINDEEPDTIQLVFAPTLFGDFYEGPFIYDREFQVSDIIRYYVFVTDKAFVPNKTTLPDVDQVYSISIIEIPAPVNGYFNDFNAVTSDFNGNGFRIGAVGGFPDRVIQSADHPYPEGGPGQVVDFTYELIKPIIVSSSESLIEFDEIALVEFGETATRWPSERFYDYVIVEARHLRGAEYFPLIDGYDCTAYPQWRTRYESGLNAQGISSATPSPDLLRHRVIDIRDKGDFMAGDTILVRFRLFSDNAAAGWGWLIDNLKIQNTSTSTEDIVIPGQIEIFPNPVYNRSLNIGFDLEENYNDVFYSIYDITGALVQRQKLGAIAGRSTVQIDSADLKNGMYIMEIHLDNKLFVSRKILVQQP